MCGRFALFASGEEVAERFQLVVLPLFEPRYNIAPTQSVAAVRSGDEGRSMSFLRWGLIPSWSADPKIAYKLINARSETVAEKPSFRSAFKTRRCLIPSSAFYEWQKTGKSKQPYCIRPRDGGLFSFAGLWEHWNDPQGEVIESCSVLTTAANELMQPIHDRMPVILDSASEEAWLDPRSSTDAIQSLFVPYATRGWKPSRSVRMSATSETRGRSAWNWRSGLASPSPRGRVPSPNPLPSLCSALALSAWSATPGDGGFLRGKSLQPSLRVCKLSS